MHRIRPRPAWMVTAVALTVLGVVAPVNSSSGQRSHADRPDRTDGPQIHVIYFLPADASDRRLDIDGTIQHGLQGLQGWFSDQSGGFQWRFDTVDSPSQVDVTFVRGLHPTEDYASWDVADELTARRFTRPDKKYLVLFDGRPESSGLCGQFTYYVNHPLSEGFDGRLHSGGQFAHVFLNAEHCRLDWGDIERPGRAQAVVMHELLHVVGMVPLTAPHHCTGIGGPAHVCGTPVTGLVPFQETAQFDPERFDVMFPALMGPLHEQTLDRGNDDYFCTLVGANDPGVTYDLATSDWVIAPPDHTCGQG